MSLIDVITEQRKRKKGGGGKKGGRALTKLLLSFGRN